MKELVLDLVIDGKFMATGNLVSETGAFNGWNFKVIEAAENNGANLKTGDMIALDNAKFPSEFSSDDTVIAKGTTKGADAGKNFGLRITEIIKT